MQIASSQSHNHRYVMLITTSWNFSLMPISRHEIYAASPNAGTGARKGGFLRVAHPSRLLAACSFAVAHLTFVALYGPSLLIRSRVYPAGFGPSAAKNSAK